MIEFLYTVLAICGCILLFALAVLIHEFGHFIAAKALGLRVEAFSIFFGKPLWKKKVGECEYRIGWLPLGGYVALPDLDPDGTKAIEGASRAGSPRSQNVAPWKKIVVAFAGPFGNIVLAVALAVALSFLPEDRFGVNAPQFGMIIKDSPAHKAGLKAGDTILKVGDKPVASWYEMQVEIQLLAGRETPFTILRGEEELVLPVTPEQAENSSFWIVGGLSAAPRRPAWMSERSAVKQLEWDFSSIARILKALVTPKESGAAASNLGGPINIAESLYVQVRHSPADAAGFLRFLNVNLAMLNLLPIPVLDGGIILFALIELLTRRRLNKRFVSVVTMGFMYLLLAAMGYIIFRDVVRSYNMHTAKPIHVEVVEPESCLIPQDEQNRELNQQNGAVTDSVNSITDSVNPVESLPQAEGAQ